MFDLLIKTFFNYVSVFVLISPILTSILIIKSNDRLISKNRTQEMLYLLNGNYFFIKKEEHFYKVLIIDLIIFYVLGIGIIACDSLYVVLIEQCLALFNIVK